MDKIIKEVNSEGTVKIAQDVIAVVAGIATNEIEGIYGMAGNLSSGIVELFSKKNIGKGVNVSIKEDDTVEIDINVIVFYGVKILDVCAQIQTAVKKTVEEMIGMQVSSVNVYVQDIHVKEETIEKQD